MDLREFRRLRVGTISNLPPASGAVIEAAASALRRRLLASDMFAGVVVGTTEEPEHLLDASVRYFPNISVRQVSSYLEAVWVAELRLAGLDAFNFQTDGGRVQLEAITGDASSGHFITLRLVAEEGTAKDFATRPPAAAQADPGARAKRRWLRR